MNADNDDIFYPKNEYLDKKWELAQSYIMKIANGKFDLTLPENIGYDHIDAILLALKLAAESLKDREEFNLTVGAFQGINKGLAILSPDYTIIQMNKEFEQMTQNQLSIGDNIFKLKAFDAFKKQFQWMDEEIVFQKKFSILSEKNVLEITVSNFLKTFVTKNKGYLMSIKSI